MNRKWLLGAVAGALVLAAALLIVGRLVGRSIAPSISETPPPAPTKTTPSAPKPRTPIVERFTDNATNVSVSYPASWTRRRSQDATVRFLAASDDGRAGISISVRDSGLTAAVTSKTIAAVRPLTDDLIRADRRIVGRPRPTAVSVGGLPGFRYEYTYRTSGGGHGAHVHYFLFSGERLVQIVMQALPASSLKTYARTFDRIAGTFEIAHR